MNLDRTLVSREQRRKITYMKDDDGTRATITSFTEANLLALQAFQSCITFYHDRQTGKQYSILFIKIEL
jgi:hypothetical protein